LSPLRFLAALALSAAACAAGAQTPLRPLAGAQVLDVVPLDGGQRELRGLSGLAWDDDEGWLVAVTDHGVLQRWQIDLEGGHMAAVVLLGLARLDGPRVDAESLCLLHASNGQRGDTRLRVADERRFELIELGYDARVQARSALPPALAAARSQADDNRGVEAIECHPRHGLLAAPQRPIPPHGRELHRAYAADGRVWAWRAANGRSTVKAMHLIGERRLLVLERLNSEVGEHPALREIDLDACSEAAPCNPAVVRLDDPRLGGERYEGLACRDDRLCWIVSDGALPRLALLHLSR
jgi:Esterase-like activity of phytase